MRAPFTSLKTTITKYLAKVLHGYLRPRRHRPELRVGVGVEA
jgi:hypothetical protein